MIINYNKLLVCCGVPASGKSTFAKQLVEEWNSIGTPLYYLSSDELRGKFGTSESDQNVSYIVFKHIKQKIDELLPTQSVIVDATSINRKERKNYIDLAKKHNAEIIAYVFILPKEILSKRNIERGQKGGRVVPEHIIEKMINKFVPPTITEGFDNIIKIYNYDSYI